MNYALAPCAPSASTAPAFPRTTRPARRMPGRRPDDIASPPRTLPSFEHDVMNGLAQRAKSIPSSWLHDGTGAALFERVAQCADYYPAASESRILERCARAIAQAAGPRPMLVEVGGAAD